jgi:hypothetical protein
VKPNSEGTNKNGPCFSCDFSIDPVCVSKPKDRSHLWVDWNAPSLVPPVP